MSKRCRAREKIEAADDFITTRRGAVGAEGAHAPRARRTGSPSRRCGSLSGDPTSEFSRFEEKIRREEAKVAGKAELAASRLDVQFEALEDEERTPRSMPVSPS